MKDRSDYLSIEKRYFLLIKQLYINDSLIVIEGKKNFYNKNRFV